MRFCSGSVLSPPLCCALTAPLWQITHELQFITILKDSEPDLFKNTDAITVIDCLPLVEGLLAELSALWWLWWCVCKRVVGGV